MKTISAIFLSLMLCGCGAELTPNIHKAQQEERQTDEDVKQTKLMLRQTIALEAIADHLTGK